MGTTPNLALPYPENTAAVDVPLDIKNLALAVDAKGFTRVGTKAQRTAYTASQGMTWYETDTGDSYVYSGAAWVFTGATAWAQWMGDGSVSDYVSGGTNFMKMPQSTNAAFPTGVGGPITWTTPALPGSPVGTRLVPSVGGRYRVTIAVAAVLQSGATQFYGALAQVGTHDGTNPTFEGAWTSHPVWTYGTSGSSTTWTQEVRLSQGSGITANFTNWSGLGTPGCRIQALTVRRVGA